MNFEHESVTVGDEHEEPHHVLWNVDFHNDRRLGDVIHIKVTGHSRVTTLAGLKELLGPGIGKVVKADYEKYYQSRVEPMTAK